MAAKKPKLTARGKALQRNVGEAFDVDVIKALGHEWRVLILSLLMEGKWSPKMIDKELGFGLSQVSYHVKELKKFGMIELTKTKPRRGALGDNSRPVEQRQTAVVRREPQCGPERYRCA